MKKPQRDNDLPEEYVKLLRDSLAKLEKLQPPPSELEVLEERIHNFLQRRPGGIARKSPERLPNGGSVWLVETCPFEDDAHPHPHGYQTVTLRVKGYVDYYCRDCGGARYWGKLEQIAKI